LAAIWSVHVHHCYLVYLHDKSTVPRLQAVMEIIRSRDTSAGVVDVELEEVAEGTAEEEQAAAAAAAGDGAGPSGTGGSSSSSGQQLQNGAVGQQLNGTHEVDMPQQGQAPQQQQAAGTTAQAAAAGAEALADATAQKLAV
jgi:hypothetical protein